MTYLLKYYAILKCMQQAQSFETFEPFLCVNDQLNLQTQCVMNIMSELIQ